MKFMQSLEPKIHEKLVQLADEKGITLQELVRAVIIPFYLEFDGHLKPEERKLIR